MLCPIQSLTPCTAVVHRLFEDLMCPQQRLMFSNPFAQKLGSFLGVVLEETCKVRFAVLQLVWLNLVVALPVRQPGFDHSEKKLDLWNTALVRCVVPCMNI